MVVMLVVMLFVTVLLLVLIIVGPPSAQGCVVRMCVSLALARLMAIGIEPFGGICGCIRRRMCSEPEQSRRLKSIDVIDVWSINPGIAVTGKLVLSVPKPKEEDAAST